MVRARIAFVLACAGLLAMVHAHSVSALELVERDAARAAATGDVDVRDNSFAPATIQIEEGDTVRWQQSGSGQHSVTADDDSFDSHATCPPTCMGEGDEFEQTFADAGTYRYYCKIHGGEGGTGMSGRVVVRAANTQTGSTEDDTDVEQTRESNDAIAATGSEALPMTAAALLLIAAGLVLRSARLRYR